MFSNYGNCVRWVLLPAAPERVRIWYHVRRSTGFAPSLLYWLRTFAEISTVIFAAI